MKKMDEMKREIRWGGEDEGEVMKKEYVPEEIVKERRKLGLVGWERNNKSTFFFFFSSFNLRLIFMYPIKLKSTNNTITKVH